MRPATTVTAVILALLQQSPPDKPTVPARAEVLVLGVYHMSNPGHDIFNMQADDGLAPNEIEQLGLRLAKELGHKTVYGVDADGEFPYPRLVKYAKATERTKELDALMGEVGDMVKAQDAYLASHTVLETLLYMNADDKVAQDVGYYYRQAHLGEAWDWAGADLVADWFRRNVRIYSNVIQLADSPTERVLVIFGAGHLGWLQHDFASDPTVRLRKLGEFAK